MTNITVSLEWAKKLKEAGWPQGKGYFYRVVDKTWYQEECEPRRRWVAKGYQFYSLPTAEEILRELPQTMDGYRLTIYPIWDVGAWCVTYLAPDHTPHEALEIDYVDKSLANAAAEMWIYLKKNNLLPN